MIRISTFNGTNLGSEVIHENLPAITQSENPDNGRLRKYANDPVRTGQ